MFIFAHRLNVTKAGLPLSISYNPDPTVPPPPNLGCLFPHPMHSKMLIESAQLRLWKATPPYEFLLKEGGVYIFKY